MVPKHVTIILAFSQMQVNILLDVQNVNNYGWLLNLIADINRVFNKHIQLCSSKWCRINLMQFELKDFILLLRLIQCSHDDIQLFYSRERDMS